MRDTIAPIHTAYLHTYTIATIAAMASGHERIGIYGGSASQTAERQRVM